MLGTALRAIRPRAVKALQGNVIVVGRESKYSRYGQDLVTFEEGTVTCDHRDAAGFIKLNALRLTHVRAKEKEAGVVVSEALPHVKRLRELRHDTAGSARSGVL